MKKKLFSVLLALTLVVSMSTSVFALRSDDAAYDTPAFGPIEFSEDSALGTAAANIQTGVGASCAAVEEGNGKVLSAKNWYVSGGSTGGGKYVAFPKYSGAPTYTDVKVEFDLKTDLGNKLSVMGSYSGTNNSITDRYGLFTVTATRGITLYDSSTALATLNEGWNHIVMYINTDTDIYTVYVENKLVIHNTTALANEAYTAFKGLQIYNESIHKSTNITTTQMETGVYAYIDNVKFTGRAVPEDVSAYAMPEYYPEDMNSFISFNGMTYADQPVGTTALKTGQGVAGSVVNDSANFYVPNSGVVVGATLHPHSTGSNDKFLRIHGKNDHSYMMYLLNGSSGITFKTLNPIITETGETDEDGNPVTEITGYNEPTFHDDARYLYFTAKIGGLMDYMNAALAGSPANPPRFHLSTDIYNSGAKKHSDAGGALVYFTEGKIRSTASYQHRQIDVDKEAEKFYRVDSIYDMHTGVIRTYVDGKFLREFDPISYYTSNSDFQKLTRIRIQLMPRTVVASQIDIDNIGYKVYSKYVDDEKTTERTIDDVLGDVFGKPHIKYTEILSSSTKAELNVLSRAAGLKADGSAAGYVAVVAKDGEDQITNITFAPTSAGAQFEASFTENLATTNKIVTYYFGNNMQVLDDPIIIDYDVNEYPDPVIEEE